MSQSTTSPSTTSSSRKRAFIVVIAVALVLALAAVIGPIVYARSQSAAPAPLSAGASPGGSTSTPSSAGPSASTADDGGTWQVGKGSEAGYRVEEVLNGQDVTVVGRTADVSGTVEITDDRLSAAEIVVDVASVTTDSDRRDGYFRENAMKVAEHETATFTLTEPVALPEIGADPVEVRAAGDLELAGESRPVTATITVARDGAAVKASGAVDVTFSDWGIEAPNLGFVKVEDSGQIEFLVQLER